MNDQSANEPRPVGCDATLQRNGLKLFGPDHCLSGSNFPVDKIGCSYNLLWSPSSPPPNLFGEREGQAASRYGGARLPVEVGLKRHEQAWCRQAEFGDHRDGFGPHIGHAG
jgi:hypothetical protein